MQFISAFYLSPCLGRAMAQAVSRRSLTEEARVLSRVNACGICGGQSGTGTGFSPSCGFSPVNFIPPVLHYQEKRKKLIIFITGLHNKPQASVSSAAGPFHHKKNLPAFHWIWTTGQQISHFHQHIYRLCCVLNYVTSLHSLASNSMLW
jgi:hypothetical protein